MESTLNTTKRVNLKLRAKRVVPCINWSHKKFIKQNIYQQKTISSLNYLLQVWVNAAAQNFNSIGIGFGAMVTFSSYNKFSNNILSDVWVISMVNACTSLLAGIIVFSTLGNIALEQGKNVTDVVAEGETQSRCGKSFFLWIFE